MVSLNNTMSWSTTATDPVSTSRGTSSMGEPSKLTVPDQGRNKPLTSLASVDLPHPEGPTKATLRPDSTSRSKSLIRGSSNLEYPKVTPSICTAPLSFSHDAARSSGAWENAGSSG